MVIFVDVEYTNYVIIFNGTEEQLLETWIENGLSLNSNSGARELDTKEEYDLYYNKADAFLYVDGHNDCLYIDGRKYPDINYKRERETVSVFLVHEKSGKTSVDLTAVSMFNARKSHPDASSIEMREVSYRDWKALKEFKNFLADHPRDFSQLFTLLQAFAKEEKSEFASAKVYDRYSRNMAMQVYQAGEDYLHGEMDFDSESGLLHELLFQDAWYGYVQCRANALKRLNPSSPEKLFVLVMFDADLLFPEETSSGDYRHWEDDEKLETALFILKKTLRMLRRLKQAPDNVIGKMLYENRDNLHDQAVLCGLHVAWKRFIYESNLGEMGVEFSAENPSAKDARLARH